MPCRGAYRAAPQSFQALACLLGHRDHIVPRQELCAHMWPKQFVSDATLDACLAQARQAVGDSGHSQHVLQTRHGNGYRFVAAVEISPETRPNDAAVAFPLAPSHVYGAAEALREDIGVPLLPPEHTLQDHAVVAMRAALDAEAGATAQAAGRALTLEQAIGYALEESASNAV